MNCIQNLISFASNMPIKNYLIGFITMIISVIILVFATVIDSHDMYINRLIRHTNTLDKKIKSFEQSNKYLMDKTERLKKQTKRNKRNQTNKTTETTNYRTTNDQTKDAIELLKKFIENSIALDSEPNANNVEQSVHHNSDDENNTN